MTTNSHPTTESLDIKIGGLYSYTNPKGYTTKIRVSRVTEKSIFVTWEDGQHEHREGVTSFSKYTLIEE